MVVLGRSPGVQVPGCREGGRAFVVVHVPTVSRPRVRLPLHGALGLVSRPATALDFLRGARARVARGGFLDSEL